MTIGIGGAMGGGLRSGSRSGLAATLGLVGVLVCAGCAPTTAADDGAAVETASADEAAAADAVDETAEASPADDAAPLECGGASFYADKFVGRSTASGEPYTHEALTAAHKTLPFGTELLVRRSSDDAEVVVTVNDRGPFVEGRVIDLSKSAAETLGIVQAGVAEVCLFETAGG